MESQNTGQSGAAVAEESRVVCPRCGSGNPAAARFCHACWAALPELPAMTREEERRWTRRHLARVRRHRRLARGLTAGAVAALLAFWAYHLFEIRPPLPPASSAASSESAVGEWTMAQRDALHTGAVPGPAFSPQGATAWRSVEGGAMLSAPAVADGRVFIAVGNQGILAVDRATGERRWAVPVKGNVLSSPVAAEDLVYIGLPDWRLLALDAATGEVRWSFTAKNPIYGSATVVDGSLYIGAADAHLYALDARTGKVRWARKMKGWVASAPALHQGIIVVGDQDGELYMVDASNGTLRNQLMVSHTGVNTATLVGDVAYFSSRSGDVFAFRYTQRDIPFQKAVRTIWQQLYVWDLAPRPPVPPGLLWGRRTGESIAADLATDGTRLFVATEGGTLVALELKTGEQLWKVQGPGPLQSAPIVSGDTVVQAAASGDIWGLDAATGERRWAVSVGGTITASAALAGDTLYVPTLEGALYAVR